MKEDHRLDPMSIPSGSSFYTEKQGQYLSFIYYYTKVIGHPPAQTDFQRFFSVSPPSVNRMLVELQKKRLIARIPGQPRSVRILLQADQLPPLQ
jgi:repressor LexA